MSYLNGRRPHKHFRERGPVKNKLLKKLWICSLAFILPIAASSQADICLAEAQNPYAVKPWEVGQSVLYQIITMEGESAWNRYKISITGQEEISGKHYFWVQIDISEGEIVHGHNTIDRKLTRNISFKALVPPKGSDVFFNDPAGFISTGISPSEAIKLFVRVGKSLWSEEDPKAFFQHQDVLESTPYSQTPHAKAKIDFGKLKVDRDLSDVTVPAGAIPSWHFFVKTTPDEEYWQEGFDLWRSAEIPILGLVKMEFSKTDYWEKAAYQNGLAHRRLFSQRVPGRTRPDTCTILLLDYEPKK